MTNKNCYDVLANLVKKFLSLLNQHIVCPMQSQTFDRFLYSNCGEGNFNPKFTSPPEVLFSTRWRGQLKIEVLLFIKISSALQFIAIHLLFCLFFIFINSYIFLKGFGVLFSSSDNRSLKQTNFLFFCASSWHSYLKS